METIHWIFATIEIVKEHYYKWKRDKRAWKLLGEPADWLQGESNTVEEMLNTYLKNPVVIAKTKVMLLETSYVFYTSDDFLIEITFCPDDIPYAGTILDSNKKKVYAWAYERPSWDTVLKLHNIIKESKIDSTRETA